MSNEQPPPPLWPYIKKVWRKTRETETHYWLWHVGGEIVPILIGAGLVSAFDSKADVSGQVIDWEIIGFGLMAIGILRFLYCVLLRAPAAIDLEQREAIEGYKTTIKDLSDKLEALENPKSPLEIVFDKPRHTRIVESALLTYLEIRNTSDSKTVEGVTVRIAEIKILKTYPAERLEKNQKFVNGLIGVRLALKLVDSGPLPFAPAPAVVDLHGKSMAEFECIRVHTRTGNHTVFHGEFAEGPGLLLNKHKFWQHKPDISPPPGAYRITFVAQGKDVPPVSRSFLFWGTASRTFFMPADSRVLPESKFRKARRLPESVS